MDGSEENPIMYFDNDGTGPHFHECKDARHARGSALQDWLDRQILIGGVDDRERRAVERAIDDLRAGG